MSDLIAIGYPDRATAERVRGRVVDLAERGELDVEDVLVVATDQDGRITPVLATFGVGAASIGGAMWGGVIGMMFIGPLLGMVAGGAIAGRVAWKKAFGDSGISEKFILDLRDTLEPGSAAIVLLVRDVQLDRLDRFEERGRVIHTSLSDSDEAQLDAALAAAKR